MKVVSALIALLALSGVALYFTPLQQAHPDQALFQQYVQWKAKYGMNFNSSSDEYRFAQFKQNVEIIEENNKQNNGLVMGLTQFAAMTNEEFRQAVNLRPIKQGTVEGAEIFQKEAGKALPDKINWVDKGAVYQTQDQGHCGSCWAFAAIGGLQGIREITEGTLELLSAQQLVSCIPAEDLDPGATDGCGGSEARYAYQMTAKTGIQTWASNPYTSGTSAVVPPCTYEESEGVFWNKGLGQVTPNDVEAMKQAIQNQPLTIAVDAGGLGFQLYSGGVISSACGTDLNHAILMVGYDLTSTEFDVPFWIVQNSWGAQWGGIDGFARIEITEGDGVCGINMQVDYPTA